MVKVNLAKNKFTFRTSFQAEKPLRFKSGQSFNPKNNDSGKIEETKDFQVTEVFHPINRRHGQTTKNKNSP